MKKNEILKHFKLIFWDFDGVIKDSVEVKTTAFVKLFSLFGPELSERVRMHHEQNGGMSRYDKFPLYLKWAGIDATKTSIQEYSKKFTNLALQGVIDAPWVPGVENYLRNNPNNQTFVLVSATPQKEIEIILDKLELRNCFIKVYGSPTKKRDAVKEILGEHSIISKQCIFIGDAKADWEAAEANQISFLFRQHASNGGILQKYKGQVVKDFLGL